jgi:hypothetical protein
MPFECRQEFVPQEWLTGAGDPVPVPGRDCVNACDDLGTHGLHAGRTSSLFG